MLKEIQMAVPLSHRVMNGILCSALVNTKTATAGEINLNGQHLAFDIKINVFNEPGICNTEG